MVFAGKNKLYGGKRWCSPKKEDIRWKSMADGQQARVSGSNWDADVSPT